MTQYLQLPRLHADYPIRRFFHHRGISLSRASGSDLPYIYRLRRETVGALVEDRDDKTWNPDKERSWIEENVAIDNTYLIERTRPVGVVGLYPVNPTSVWLRHFYIEPTLQGRGFGSTVIEGVTQMASVMNLDIELFKVPKGGPRGFYESHGFVAIEEREDEIYMRRAS